MAMGLWVIGWGWIVPGFVEGLLSCGGWLVGAVVVIVEGLGGGRGHVVGVGAVGALGVVPGHPVGGRPLNLIAPLPV